MAPVQGKLLNYVGRVPLGVVAQITVSCILSFPRGKSSYNSRAKVAIQSSTVDSCKEDCSCSSSRKQCDRKTFRGKNYPFIKAGQVAYMDAIIFTCQLAPVSVLEFAEMAEAAGGMNFLNWSWLWQITHSAIVPPGVLTILPGSGSTTGNEIAQNPLVRKLDITVSCPITEGIIRILPSSKGRHTDWTSFGKHSREKSCHVHC